MINVCDTASDGFSLSGWIGRGLRLDGCRWMQAVRNIEEAGGCRCRWRCRYGVLCAVYLDLTRGVEMLS